MPWTPHGSRSDDGLVLKHLEDLIRRPDSQAVAASHRCLFHRTSPPPQQGGCWDLCVNKMCVSSWDMAERVRLTVTLQFTETPSYPSELNNGAVTDTFQSVCTHLIPVHCFPQIISQTFSFNCVQISTRGIYTPHAYSSPAACDKPPWTLVTHHLFPSTSCFFLCQFLRFPVQQHMNICKCVILVHLTGTSSNCQSKWSICGGIAQRLMYDWRFWCLDCVNCWSDRRVKELSDRPSLSVFDSCHRAMLRQCRKTWLLKPSATSHCGVWRKF